MSTDVRNLVFVKRRFWLPRLCNECWRFPWFVVGYKRLQPKYQAVQVMCRRCGDERLV